MISMQLDRVRIELTVGDIADQPDADAVVNAANAELIPGGGVAGALHRAAGPGLAAECHRFAPLSPGECVQTSGHQLPNPYVIHCLGPVMGIDEPAEQLLTSCYHRALQQADHHLESVAFPAISTGAFGYPMQDAARVALGTIANAAPQLRHVRLVRMVLADRTAFAAHKSAMEITAAE